MANTSRLKVGEDPEVPWKALLIPGGALAGAGLGALRAARGKPRDVLRILKQRGASDFEVMRMAGHLLMGGGLGSAAGATAGSYLENRMPKEGALSKFALGIQQPNMVTKSLRSAAGREGGYTAGNLAKGSGAFKPTRITSTLQEGKSSVLDQR